MNRPGKFPPSHPAAQYAATKLREAGYSCYFDEGFQEWLVTSSKVAALDRNIHKVINTLCAKLLHRKHQAEHDILRRILLEMEEI